jgi:hypothetical protein
MARRDDQHMRRPHQRQQLLLRHEAVESEPIGDIELAREPLDFAGERVLADYVDVESS